jgi:hypothetical protein
MQDRQSLHIAGNGGARRALAAKEKPIRLLELPHEFAGSQPKNRV